VPFGRGAHAKSGYDVGVPQAQPWSGSRWDHSPLFDPPSRRPPRADEDVAAVAALVDDPTTFVARERGERGALGEYRLRQTGRRFVMRHGTKDIAILDEIFVRRFYEPPEPVAAILSSLGAPPRVIDIGAHIGLAGVYFLGLLGRADLVAYEPDRGNHRLLERCTALNADAGSWTTVRACAGDRHGTVLFVDGASSSSQLAADGEQATGTVPMVDVLPALVGADLLKIDSEGGEWAVLEDPRFARSDLRVVVAEYHAYLCPDRSPRRRIERTFERAGYRTHHLFERGQGDIGMLWAWRP
jgi:FkbM family methyltransferase